MSAKIGRLSQNGHQLGFCAGCGCKYQSEQPIIGNRSFGSEVSNVISSALSYSNGLQDNNILAAIKHFPGHGDTSTDSHLDLPVVPHNMERLNTIELAPSKLYE
jgi:beta-glucosidase-like glycosyl hydrolase